jgi:hypothetical protein
MSLAIGAGFLVAYYLLMIEIALATHAVGVFRISFWKFGPTELRILLAVGTLRLIGSDFVTLAGAGLVVTFIASAAANTRALYRTEPLPARETAPISRPKKPAGCTQSNCAIIGR